MADNGNSLGQEVVTTSLTFPLTSRHFPPTTSTVTVLNLPKPNLAGNKAPNGSALNTGLSVWFGAENLIGTLGPVLDEHVPSARAGGGSALELGAGTGLAGLYVLDYFAARSEAEAVGGGGGGGGGETGRTRVDLTDGIDEALDLLERNVELWLRRRGRSEEKGREEGAADDRRRSRARARVAVNVSKNLWGVPPTAGDTRRGCPEDGWGAEEDAADGLVPPGGYDVVFGGDLIYERDERIKMEALASTVVWMLSGREDPKKANSGDGDGNEEDASTPPVDGYINDKTYDPKEGIKRGRPVFVLAFTRRSFPLSQLIGIMMQSGMEYEGTLENSCYDLFGNCTDGLTDMWRDCVLVFSLKVN